MKKKMKMSVRTFLPRALQMAMLDQLDAVTFQDDTDLESILDWTSQTYGIWFTCMFTRTQCNANKFFSSNQE